MRIDRIILFLVLVTISALIAIPATSQANLLTNPGFETGDFTGWSYSGYFVDISNENPHTNNYHTRISYGGIYQSVEVAAGESYKLTAWVYVPEQDVAGSDVGLNFYDDNSDVVGGWSQSMLDFPRNQYNKIESDWLTASEGAVVAEVFGTAGAEFEVYVDFDDFDVSPIPEPTSILLLGLGLSGLVICAKKSLKKAKIFS